MYLRKAAVAFAFALLLLAAAGSQPAAARAIPWDCSDWQAFAHADRTTSILESLAENRGKTLYCGIDQSDTFAKAETWEAGKDRNERDDTVYFGERGQFRGFIAAQEGWLTEGASGVTGVSRDRIFEFPREERRVKRTKRFDIANDADQFPIDQQDSCGQVGGLICTPLAARSTSWSRPESAAQDDGRHLQTPGINTTSKMIDWRTQVVYEVTGNEMRGAMAADGRQNTTDYSTAWWQEQAAAAANAACRARGARYVAGSADFGAGHSNNRGTGVQFSGNGLGWFYKPTTTLHPTEGVYYWRTQARQSRTWTATCKKTIRRKR